MDLAEASRIGHVPFPDSDSGTHSRLARYYGLRVTRYVRMGFSETAAFYARAAGHHARAAGDKHHHSLCNATD